MEKKIEITEQETIQIMNILGAIEYGKIAPVMKFLETKLDQLAKVDSQEPKEN